MQDVFLPRCTVGRFDLAIELMKSFRAGDEPRRTVPEQREESLGARQAVTRGRVRRYVLSLRQSLQSLQGQGRQIRYAVQCI